VTIPRARNFSKPHPGALNTKRLTNLKRFKKLTLAEAIGPCFITIETEQRSFVLLRMVNGELGADEIALGGTYLFFLLLS
jgi:hypothetical protein